MTIRQLTFATKLPPGLRTCVVILRACENRKPYMRIKQDQSRSHNKNKYIKIKHKIIFTIRYLKTHIEKLTFDGLNRAKY